jgi:hypothetical protein
MRYLLRRKAQIRPQVQFMYFAAAVWFAEQIAPFLLEAGTTDRL